MKLLFENQIYSQIQEKFKNYNLKPLLRCIKKSDRNLKKCKKFFLSKGFHLKLKKKLKLPKSLRLKEFKQLMEDYTSISIKSN